MAADDASVAAMRLHVIYRSTDQENVKPRPAYYSKQASRARRNDSSEVCFE
jgi:hypothetical protein